MGSLLATLFTSILTYMQKHIQYLYIPMSSYHKRGKIHWAKLLYFSRFSGVPQKFFCEYKCLSLIVLNYEHLWPREHESVSGKISLALKQ